MLLAIDGAVIRLSMMTAAGLLVALHTSVAAAQETPTYADYPETLNEPELEQSFAEDTEREQPAQPDGPRFHFDQRRLMFGAMLGFGTPVGEIGAVGAYTLAIPIAIGAGVGTNAYGTQLTALAIVRPFAWGRRNAAHALSFMPAWSTGPWKSLYMDIGLGHDGPDERAQFVRHAADQAHWFQADVSYELLTRNGFWLRVGYGLAWMLNPGDAHCEFLESRETTSCAGHTVKGEPADAPLLTFSITLGYALDV